MKIISLSLLFLLTTADAIRVKYYCEYANNGNSIEEHPKERKAGGTISDDYAKEVIANMRSWSDNKYTAKYSDSKAVNLLDVYCDPIVGTKDDALAANNDMQRIVNAHKPT